MEEEIEKAKKRKADIEAILSETSSLSSKIQSLEDELIVLNARISIDEPFLSLRS